MKRNTVIAVLFMTLLLTQLFSMEKIVIAHRGASGYLPEHSMACKAMAYAMGVDYIEQDVVMTKDDQLVILHDHYLDRVTDVASVYPERKRKDGRYYVIDFTLEEIRKLKMTEGFTIIDGKKEAVYSDRFPIWSSSFRVHTFEEEIELIKGLNKSTGNNIGLYPEIKSPWFHLKEGKDISKKTLEILKKYGYLSKKDKIFLQCFDPNELKRIRTKLLPSLGMDLKLVQLIAMSLWCETMELKDGSYQMYFYEWMFQPGGMAKVAEYADGVGPWKPMIISPMSTKDKIIVTDLVKDAHAAGMKVHPYTFRLDKGKIPEYAASYEDMLNIFYYKAGVDGVFTDFPDRAVEFIRRTEKFPFK